LSGPKFLESIDVEDSGEIILSGGSREQLKRGSYSRNIGQVLCHTGPVVALLAHEEFCIVKSEFSSAHVAS